MGMITSCHSKREEEGCRWHDHIETRGGGGVQKGTITSRCLKQEEEGCRWARSCLIIRNKRRRGADGTIMSKGEEEKGSFDATRGGRVRLGTVSSRLGPERW